jgi:hypothetical protein
MKNTHTPAPWSILDRPENALDDARILTHISNGSHIVCTLGTTCTDGSPAHSANARIIASAPELLAALEEARIALTFYRNWMTLQTEGRTDYPFGIRAEDRARAAIAKAKGGAA